MQSLLVPCKRCGAPIDAGARASLVGSANMLLDAACGSCGRRALYEVPQGHAAGN